MAPLSLSRNAGREGPSLPALRDKERGARTGLPEDRKCVLRLFSRSSNPTHDSTRVHGRSPVATDRGYLACEQALWLGKERRKQRARTSEETGRGWKRKEGEKEGGRCPALFPSLRSARSAR